MAPIAYQLIPLKEPLTVPSDTRPSSQSFKINIASSGHDLTNVLEQTASSTFALRAPSNDNSALLAELNKRIQSNKRIQVANQQQADVAVDEMAAPMMTLSDPELEQPEPVEPILTAVERTQIELAETVQFIKELRADPERRMSKREAKQFLQFAAGQAALSITDELTPQTASQPMLAADAAHDPIAVAPSASSIQMNPLALQALADNYGRIMPLADATPQTVFQNNLDVMTQVQPDAAAEAAPLPRVLQSELKLIAEDTQFNPNLVRQARALQNPLPLAQHNPHTQLSVLPDAVPQPVLALSNEEKVQEIVIRAKQEQAAAEQLKLDAHINNYMRARSLDVTFTSGETTSIKIDRALVDTNLQKTIEDRPDMSLADKRIEADSYKLQIADNYDKTINKQADMLMNSRWISSLDVRDGINHNITHNAKADGTPIIYELNSNANEIAENKAKDPLVRSLNSGLSGLSAA